MCQLSEDSLLTKTKPFWLSDQSRSSSIFTAATDIFTRRVYTMQIPLGMEKIIKVSYLSFHMGEQLQTLPKEEHRHLPSLWNTKHYMIELRETAN